MDRLQKLGELKCGDAVATQLKKISGRTIDRALAREKRVRHLQRDRNPSVHRLISQQVPVKAASEWETSEVGNVHVDYVAHCGRSAGGSGLYTLSAVEIATNWWEGEAIPAWSQQTTNEGIGRMLERFPFRLPETHPDNDSGLVNDLLWEWARRWKIRMSESRPYKRNDNAWVEHENRTRVRKIAGYWRFDTTGEMRLLNELYGVLRLSKNFCLPTIRLAGKERVGDRIKRTYDKARTPYQRLLESKQVPEANKEELNTIYESLNPAALSRQIAELRGRLEA